jgi:hypothetical protein
MTESEAETAVEARPLAPRPRSLHGHFPLGRRRDRDGFRRGAPGGSAGSKACEYACSDEDAGWRSESHDLLYAFDRGRAVDPRTRSFTGASSILTV